MPRRDHADSLANRLAALAQTKPAQARRAAGGPVQRTVARPDLAASHDVLRLQQRYGNRAVQRWLASGGAVQAQLTVGPTGDTYEREADRVADQVVGRLGVSSLQRRLDDNAQVQRQPLAAAITPLAQRRLTEDEEMRRKTLEDDELKRAPEAGAGRAGGPASASTSAAIDQARGGGQRLPAPVRRPLEAAFGADFGGVKIHTDSRADRLSRSLSARAFTTGRDVFFRKGEFDPGTRQGQKLLAHELTHVVQQGGAQPVVRRAPEDEQEKAKPPEQEEQEPELRDGITGRRVERLLPGDVLFARTGRELSADLVQSGRFLQRLWRGQARGAVGAFAPVGLALNGSTLVRGQGNGVAKEPVQGHYYVFRCSNRALAALAAQVAENWSVFENSLSGVDSKYSLPRNFDALAYSSRYNRTRAVNLAAAFLEGASANTLLCADFTIMCYQAAAMLEDVHDLKGATPPPAPVAEDDQPGRPKSGLAALPAGALQLDPRRIRPFQFASELHRLAQGDNPSWDVAGLY